MIQYPITFKGGAEAGPGMADNWNVYASRFESTCCVPQEFEGEGGTFSPEDYFLLSLQNCFIATFKVFAQYSRLTFKNLEVAAELIVDKGENHKVVMKSLHLKINLSGVSDEKKTQMLVKKTLENGFILQSVKTEITHDLIIS